MCLRSEPKQLKPFVALVRCIINVPTKWTDTIETFCGPGQMYHQCAYEVNRYNWKPSCGRGSDVSSMCLRSEPIQLKPSVPPGQMYHQCAYEVVVSLLSGVSDCVARFEPALYGFWVYLLSLTSLVRVLSVLVKFDQPCTGFWVYLLSFDQPCTGSECTC